MDNRLSEILSKYVKRHTRKLVLDPELDRRFGGDTLNYIRRSAGEDLLNSILDTSSDSIVVERSGVKISTSIYTIENFDEFVRELSDAFDKGHIW